MRIGQGLESVTALPGYKFSEASVVFGKVGKLFGESGHGDEAASGLSVEQLEARGLE